MSDDAKIRRIARVALDAVNTLPEAHGRRVVRFLALLYLRPADCRKIERILTPEVSQRTWTLIVLGAVLVVALVIGLSVVF